MCGSRSEIGGPSPVDRQTLDPPDSRLQDKCGSKSKVCAPSLVDLQMLDLKNPLFMVLCRQGVMFFFFPVHFFSSLFFFLKKIKK